MIASEFCFWMDMRCFYSTRERLTGGEIKEIAGTSRGHPVYEDSFRGASSDKHVGDGELVDIRDRHF